MKNSAGLSEFLKLNKMLICLTLSIAILFLITSCVSQKENIHNSNLQPNQTSKSSSNNSENDVPLPKPTTQEVQVDVSEALKEAEKRIDGCFQKCSNGMTYTMSGSRIYEIENFDFNVIPEKDRPTYIELKNKTTWVGKIVFSSMATRDYEIVSGCWSKYNSTFDKMTLSFSKDDSIWNLKGLENYKSPTCKDVEPYVAKKNTCPQ